MPDSIGNISVPEILASGTFPIPPEYPHGRVSHPDVAIHQFGSGNAKIEQRFLLGTGARHFTVRRTWMNDTQRIALRDFWESKYGPYGAFTYNAPNDDGNGTTAYTCRFANEPLSWQMVADWVCSVGMTLIEIPSNPPTYTLNSTVTRFPSQALKEALLSQVQQVIPLIKIQPLEAGYPAIHVSDRRCTVGAQLYQARLIDFDGISQGMGNEADDATFVFGNADRVMRQLANDVDLYRASIEFSLFHVGTGVKIDLWKGDVVNWSLDAGPEFKVTASDGLYELNLPYPTRKISRTCWKKFDGQACPYADHGALDLVHFPDAAANSCDKNYDTPNGWQRFFQLELPYGAIGLIWNSMVSVAGGWFFLMACEMFVLGSRDFRLPGLGSYLQTAASTGDIRAVGWGLAAMIAVIVLIDQVIWRPLIAWSEKFKFEQVETLGHGSPLVLNLIRRSRLLSALDKLLGKTSERLKSRTVKRAGATTRPRLGHPLFPWAVSACALFLAGYGLLRAVLLLAGITANDWMATIERAGLTFLRVNTALLIAAAWTIPAGVAIGFHPRLARIAQPVAQIAASVPATALFPVVLLVLIRVGGGLGIASILLMLLGTQWYILFNVIAGALAIPSEFKEVGSIFRFNQLQQWRVIILPAIFPYLVTGLVTASGGAWNASIVAEYFHLKGRIFTTAGLGAQISSASDAGRFDVLFLSTVVMALVVVSINRSIWRPLYRLAESRYRLES